MIKKSSVQGVTQTTYDVVSSLPEVPAIVLLEYNYCRLHGSVPLPLEVSTDPLLDEDHKPGQYPVSLVFQELVILVLERQQKTQEWNTVLIQTASGQKKVS